MVVGEFTESADLVVIGAGPGGYVAAIRAAQLGRSVTLVEREQVGGICLNVGCIPSKALIWVADFYARAHTMGSAGIHIDAMHFEMSEALQYKAQIVKKLTDGVRLLLDRGKVTLMTGEARFVSPHQVRVVSEYESKKVEFKDAIVATGSRPRTLPEAAVDGDVIIGSTEALSQTTLPERLVVIGAGYIGMELGTAFQKLGSQVTVLESGTSILPGIDPALSRVVGRRARELGMTFETGVSLTAVERRANVADVVFSQGEVQKKLTADRVLVTVGRVPNADQLDLHAAGITVDDRGFIPVDDSMVTANPHVYAIGDVVGNPMLAHKASHQGKVAAEAAGGLPSAFDVLAVPAVIFTDPEIATVGLTESEATRKGMKVVTGSFPFAANGRALTLNAPEGHVSVVADAASGRVVGVEMVGPEVSNLVAEAGLALEMGAVLEDVALTIHAHPTLSETLMEAAEVALGRPIHVAPRS